MIELILAKIEEIKQIKLETLKQLKIYAAKNRR